MSTTTTVKDQVNAVADAIRKDVSIPAQHKTVLQSILSFILHLAPVILSLFADKGGQLDGNLGETLIVPAQADVHPELHPIAESLDKAVVAASAKATADRSILTKIFAFVLKILPTVIGLFSHSPDSVPGVGNAPSGGASLPLDNTVAGGDTDTMKADGVEKDNGNVNSLLSLEDRIKALEEKMSALDL